MVRVLFDPRVPDDCLYKRFAWALGCGYDVGVIAAIRAAVADEWQSRSEPVLSMSLEETANLAGMSVKKYIAGLRRRHGEATGRLCSCLTFLFYCS